MYWLFTTPTWLLITGAIAFMVASVLLTSFAIRASRKFLALDKRATKDDRTPRCDSCGYPLEHLKIPRCPECGALRGFKVPLDQLGLTEDEVRAGFARDGLQHDANRSPTTSE